MNRIGNIQNFTQNGPGFHVELNRDAVAPFAMDTTLNWMRLRAKALEISGAQQAQQLASHSPVSMLG